MKKKRHADFEELCKSGFSKRLCYYRYKCGLTQSALAEVIGSKQSAISKWENGHAFPKIAKALLLIIALQINALDLVHPPDSLYCKHESEQIVCGGELLIKVYRKYEVFDLRQSENSFEKIMHRNRSIKNGEKKHR